MSTALDGLISRKGSVAFTESKLLSYPSFSRSFWEIDTILLIGSLKQFSLSIQDYFRLMQQIPIILKASRNNQLNRTIDEQMV